MADTTAKVAKGKVTFEYKVRIAAEFKDGKPTYRNKGERVTMNPDSAAKFVKLGLGKIIGDAAPLQVSS